MKLRKCCEKIEIITLKGDLDIHIKGIHIDSRNVNQGDCFVAVRGTQTDGHDYIKQAIAQGAKAILCQEIPEQLEPEITYIQVENTEQIVGQVATQFYENPTQSLQLVGVTGTNGKTTIATLLYHLFRKLGYKVGLISTVCNYIEDEAIPTEHTTPDPIALNQLLKRMYDVGCDYVFMEVSSHSLVQNRVGGLHFEGAIFTNITRDHIDYHKTMENYIAAKKLFFDRMSTASFSLTNFDDPSGKIMIKDTAAQVASYALHADATYKATILESHLGGMHLNLDGQEVALHFVGEFNAYNLLAVYATAILLGQDKTKVIHHLTTLKSVRGRLETLRSPRGYDAIVDYAHTDDAVTNVLKAVRNVMKSEATLIAVVGAGGNRDKGKRPLMAQAAVKGATKVVLTSDNPRNEDPEEIIKDMLAGLTDEQKQHVVCITDRREAIQKACQMAQKDDAIVIAGKGHEDYQIVKGVKHHFDDCEEIRKVFETEK